MKKIDENDSFDNNLDKDIVEYFFGNVKKQIKMTLMMNHIKNLWIKHLAE